MTINNPKIGICGLGLIGGSLAKAFRVAFLQARIIAADTDRETLVRAAADGCIDEAVQTFDGCDFLFLCAPPGLIPSMLVENDSIGVITDVASVKLPIMKAAAGLANFVGGHPMAGSEGSGYGASDAGLFKGASWIICPSSNVEKVERLEQLVSSIGARPIRMDAEAHDRRMALISHLPHVAAFALASSPELRDDPLTRSLIGGGFRDTTRIAASAPALWADIFQESAFLPEAIDAYIDELRALKALITSDKKNTLEASLRIASDFRKTIPEGLRHKIFNK